MEDEHLNALRLSQERDWMLVDMATVAVKCPPKEGADAERFNKLCRHWHALQDAQCAADMLRAGRFYIHELANIVHEQAAEIDGFAKSRTAAANRKRIKNAEEKRLKIMLLAQSYRGKKTKEVAADEIATKVGMGREEVRRILCRLFTRKEWKNPLSASNAEYWKA